MKYGTLAREKAIYDSVYLVVCTKRLLLRSLHVKGDLMVGKTLESARKIAKLCTSLIHRCIFIEEYKSVCAITTGIRADNSLVNEKCLRERSASALYRERNAILGCCIVQSSRAHQKYLHRVEIKR